MTGTKEQALREMRETKVANAVAKSVGKRSRKEKALIKSELASHHKAMIDDGLPPALVRTGPAPKLGKKHADAGVTLALPVAVQKAIAADLKDEPSVETTSEQESGVMRTNKAKGKSTIAKAANGKHNPKNTKLEKIAELLKRKDGCTTADILKATGWPSVSVPASAKSAGLKLKKVKDGKTTRYFAV